MKVRTTLVKATEVRGERIRARCGSRRTSEVRTLTVAYDYGMSAVANHAQVARLLAHKVSGETTLYPTQVGTHQRGYDWTVE